jgi:hypothetical protein
MMDIKRSVPKIYSQDLINNLFKHPYTKIDLLLKTWVLLPDKQPQNTWIN